MKFRTAFQIVMIAVGVFILGVFCYSPQHSKEIQANDAVRRGFRIAQQCLPSAVQLSDIRLYVIPGNAFTVLWSDGSPKTGFALYRRIFVAESHQDNKLNWAHEFIHVFGVIGHPDKYFKRCNL